MTENEKIELFDKWYDENYDEWAEGEEGIALREELEQAFKGGIEELEKENAELKEKFLKIKKDDVRKSKLDSFKTFEEKNEYLRQVANYAIFNEDISVMFWCFVQRGDIYTEQLTKAKEIIKKLYSHVFQGMGFMELNDYNVQKAEAEQFISEVEK